MTHELETQINLYLSSPLGKYPLNVTEALRELVKELQRLRDVNNELLNEKKERNKWIKVQSYLIDELKHPKEKSLPYFSDVLLRDQFIREAAAKDKTGGTWVGDFELITPQDVLDSGECGFIRGAHWAVSDYQDLLLKCCHKAEEQLQAANKEIERLKIWSSDSHIQDVEQDNKLLRLQIEDLEAQVKGHIRYRELVRKNK